MEKRVECSGTVSDMPPAAVGAPLSSEAKTPQVDAQPSDASKAEASFKPVSAVVPDDSERRTRSLSYSIVDGGFASVMTGFGESFFSAFAIFLNASAGQLALLASLPRMIGSIVQLFTRRLILLFQGRRRLVVLSATLQALMHLPALVAYFLGSLSVPFLIFCVSFYFLFGMVGGPAWNSWMGDLVEAKSRGAYFGRRNFFCGFASFASFLAAGYILQFYTETIGEKFFGFLVLFIVAACARLASAYFLSLKYEPAFEMQKTNPFPFKAFVESVRTSNFGTFVAFQWIFNFGVFLAGPFFTPYQLSELGLSYLQFTIITAASIGSKLLFMPVWGRAADRFGMRKLMILSAWLVVFLPLLWIFADSVPYLIFIEILSGFAWAGLDITLFNFFFDCTKPQQRTTAIAYHNVINGIMLFLGSLVGGWLLTLHIGPQFGWSIYFIVFAASSFIRLLACAFFLSRVSEVREVEPVRYRHLLFSELTLEPALGLLHGAVDVTTKTSRRVRTVVLDIDDFIDEKINPRLSSVFIEVDEFLAHHVTANLRLRRRPSAAKSDTVIIDPNKKS